MNEHKKESVFSKFSPKTNFFMGLGGALVLLFVVGFFVLLGIVLNQDKSKIAGTKTSTPTAAAPTAPAPAPSPTQPTAGDIILAEITDDDWVRGDRSAKISVVEFSDLECPFCQRFHPTMQQLISEYDGQVNWVYRHFPLTSIHQQAQPAAEAAECAGAQGGNEAFWSFTDAMFDNQSRLGRDLYLEVAQNLGLNAGQFTSCIDNGEFRQKVQDHYSQATASGGRGTPHSIVVTEDGQKIPVSGAVPYEQLKSIIDPLL